MILSGVSGTGKTWLAQAYADAVGASCSSSLWRRTGRRTRICSATSIRSKSSTTTPTSAMFLRDAAAEYQRRCRESGAPRPYHLVLDEMNLARVEYYFAKFLSAMELRARSDRCRDRTRARRHESGCRRNL